MSLKLFSLNIEGHKHFARWLPVTQAGKYDVVCLQEVFAVDMEYLSTQLGMTGYFCPMLDVVNENRYGIAPMGKWGIGLFIRTSHSSPEIEYYSGTSEVRVFAEPEDASRVVMSSVLTLPDGETYRVATTHFTWTPDGKTNDAQLQDFMQLKQILGTHQDWILCGDFNAPRGGETFCWFTERFTDNLPPEIISTIDPTLHYKGKELQLAVDTIFTTPHYRVESCSVHTGLSDHCGLVADITIVNL